MQTVKANQATLMETDREEREGSPPMLAADGTIHAEDVCSTCNQMFTEPGGFSK